MDTDSLSSTISLAAFSLAFLYFCVVERTATRSNHARPRSGRVAPLSIRFLQLSAVIAVILSGHILVRSQTSSLSVEIGTGVGWLFLVLALYFAAGLVPARFPRFSIVLAKPFHGLLANLSRASEENPDDRSRQPENDGLFSGDEDRADMEETATMFISEEEQASLDPRERLMIRSILRLDETTAREVMIPRVDFVAVEKDTTIKEVAHRMLETGHSRLPVYSESTDHIIGVVHSRDLLPFLSKRGKMPLAEDLIRPAFFTPESKHLDELLKELQEKRTQMAIVIDEYGGVEGLITIEDLMEEIVGEIEDEFSQGQEPSMMPMENGDILLDGRVSLDDLPELISAKEEESIDTVGGLVFSKLGRMPQVGDLVTLDGVNLEVVSVLGRRIRTLRLSRTES